MELDELTISIIEHNIETILRLNLCSRAEYDASSLVLVTVGDGPTRGFMIKDDNRMFIQREFSSLNKYLDYIQDNSIPKSIFSSILALHIMSDCISSFERLSTHEQRTAGHLDGCFCSRCGEFYAMAAPNQPDGTLKCWLCRTYKYR